MDITTIVGLAYGGAGVASLMLAVIFLLQRYHGATRYGFCIAALACSLWMLVTGWIHFAWGMPVGGFLQAESLQHFAWAFALNRALVHVTESKPLIRQRLLMWVSGLLAFWIVTDLFVPVLFSIRQVFLIFLLQAILGLLSIEQLYRNCGGNRYFKLLCLVLGLFFFFEMMANTHSLISGERAHTVIQSRAVVVFTTCFLLAIGIVISSRLRGTAAKLSLSKPTAFYTTSLIASGAFIVVASLGAYVIKNYGGNWGWLGFVLFAFLAVGLLVLTVISRTFRLRLTLLINKHLFQHKYDYREEWLKFVNRLSQPKDNHGAMHTGFTAMASIFQSPGGAIWMRRGSIYAPLYQSGLSADAELPREPADSDFCQVLQNEGWVFMPWAADRDLQKNNPVLPRWIRQLPDAWLIVPLLAGGNNELRGFVVLARPVINYEPTWEDLDLLKLTGRELANYLQLHEQAEQLAENLQFDAYNKLTAFIMHDLNNVIAQQSLVVSNAAKHKSNPVFIDDAIDTISNSVARMEKLLTRLKRRDSNEVSVVALGEMIQSAIDSCLSGRPTPIYTTLIKDQYIQADRDRIELAISHLLKNAQEATDDKGEIHVVLNADGNMAVIAVSDSGSGMEQDFIENQLFKPFRTTKTGKGMGIGVYLTKSYIQQLGGAIEVSSQLGKGTTFTIRLPVVKPI